LRWATIETVTPPPTLLFLILLLLSGLLQLGGSIVPSPRPEKFEEEDGSGECREDREWWSSWPRRISSSMS
jgi:hypothetical protein